MDWGERYNGVYTLWKAEAINAKSDNAMSKLSQAIRVA